MQATYAVFRDERVMSLETEDLDPADLESDQILVEAEATIISPGTELANYIGLSPGVHVAGSWNVYPWRPGYGLVGRVVAAGSRVDRFKEGQRIFCFGKHASLQRYTLSESRPTASAFPVKEDLPAATVLMARMALIGLAGVQLSHFQAGDRVAVFGLGLVGNLVAQLYQLAGARLIACDPLAGRCQLARQTGIENVLDASGDDQVPAVMAHTDSQGVAVAVDAVGHADVIQACVECCAPFGQVILLGSPRAPVMTNITTVMRTIHHRWISLQGALEWRLPAYPVVGGRHSISSNLQRLTYDLREGRLKADPLITDVVAPAELERAYESLLVEPEHHLGVVIDWRVGSA